MLAALFVTASARAEIQDAGGVSQVGVVSLPNALWVTDAVLSGGTPEGEAGFAALAELGVRTVISVDGAQPNLAAAARHGLRYVHLPHGYDGVPDERRVALAKAVLELPGPIYIHCHHGRHRSPAAAVVACVGAGVLAPERGPAILAAAKTSTAYAGLHAAAQFAQPLSRATLQSASIEFPESVEPPPLVRSMTDLEETLDRLAKVQAAGWRTPDSHPDLTPAHEALMLREHYVELQRVPEAGLKGPAFLELAAEGERLTRALENELASARATRTSAGLGPIRGNCRSCHEQFRDTPGLRTGE